MAKESTESSVGTSPSALQIWWDFHNNNNHHHPPSSLSSWTNNSSCSPWHQQNPNSNNSSCEEEVSMSTSFTYSSNQSAGFTVESSNQLIDPAAASSHELLEEHAADNHQLWSHVFLNDGSNGDLHNTSQEVGENLINPLSSTTISSSTGIFDPAYDYLKKMDSSWEFTISPSSSFKQLNGISNNESCVSESDHERLNKLSSSNLVSHWSIAPPDPEISRHHHFNNNSQTCDISLSCSIDHHQYNYSNSSGTNITNPELPAYYGQDMMKMENDEEHCGFGAPAAMASSLFRKPLINSSNGLGYGFGYNSTCYSMVEADNNKYYNGMMPHHKYSQYSSARNLITPSSRLTKPLIDIHVPKPFIKSLNLSDYKKKGLGTSSPTKINGKERGSSNEGRKKRHEDTSDAVTKKPKTETCTASSAKAPKVKIADKITALQQIVSPFGKTDTASVLYEAIGYIKILQEQVQLLSNPYVKPNVHKDRWGSLERKDQKGEVKVDLRSRGLCLVPISCTPKACHENTRSDYWTPAFKGCLYR